MPANEFEKRVQERLDEFQLDPSASVWQKVEEQIREKKRRRIIFFFTLIAAIGLLGYLGYAFLYTSQENNQENIVSVNKKPSPPGQTNSTGENKLTTTSQQEANKTGLPATGTKTQRKARDANADADMQLSVTDPSIGRNKKNTTGNDSRKIKNKPAEIKQDNSLVIDTGIPAIQKVTKPADEAEIKSNTDIPVVSSQDNNSLKDEKVITPLSDSTNISPDNKEKAVLKTHTSRSKIKWGINLSAGVSTINNEIFLAFSENKSLMDNLALSNNPGTGSSVGNSPIIPPSSVKSGPAFHIGITGEWQFSKRSRLSSGLEYAYRSNRIRAGAKKDTAMYVQTPRSLTSGFVNPFYGGTPTTDYTNSYHFIRIPIWYHWQINKGKKLPLQWNMGLAVSYMFASKALIYDGSNGGIYYRDKDAFNKLHFDLGTGLSFRFKGKSNTEWLVGPELSFDMSSLLKNTGTRGQYLFFGGINGKVLFGGKEKIKRCNVLHKGSVSFIKTLLI